MNNQALGIAVAVMGGLAAAVVVYYVVVASAGTSKSQTGVTVVSYQQKVQQVGAGEVPGYVPAQPGGFQPWKP